MYNIVYSVIFHQSIDFVNHFLRNIEKYNIENNYLVIIHLSDNLYNKKNDLYKKNIIINPIHYNKKVGTHLLFKAIIENFEYLLSQKINFYNFMPLTSSNRFVRQAPKFKLQNIQVSECKIMNNQNINDGHDNCNWWPILLKNKAIVKIFLDNKIELLKIQHEGSLYSKNIMEKICKFMRKNKIIDLIEKEFVLEEILLPSLCKYFSHTLPKLYCHTFWNKPKSIPTVSEVNCMLKERKHICITKRFPEDLNHELFKALYNNLFLSQ